MKHTLTNNYLKSKQVSFHKPKSHSKASYVALFIWLLALWFGIDTINTQTASAIPCKGRCYQGWFADQLNYGSDAQIQTILPEYYGEDVFVFTVINSQIQVNNPFRTDGFIQTGWGFSSTTLEGCDTTMRPFWEYIDIAMSTPPVYLYKNGCDRERFPQPGEFHVYGQEYDGNTGIWSHLYDGQVFKFESANSSGTNFTQASSVAAYAETNNTRIQMGGPTSTDRLTIREIRYKPNPTGGFNTFTAPPYPLNNFAGCGISPCPYGSERFGDTASGNKLVVRIWSIKPLIIVTQPTDDGTGNTAGSFSAALRQALDTFGTRIVFNVPQSNINNSASSYIVPDGTLIDGGRGGFEGCKTETQRLILNGGFGSNSDGLVFFGSAALYSVIVKNFPGQQIKKPFNIGSLSIACTKAIDGTP